GAARTSTALERSLSGAQRERAASAPRPIVQRLTDPDLFDGAAVAASGITLRIATVALESGELRYITESGEVRDRQDQPVPGEPRVDLVAAIRASCAIPAVFPRCGSGRSTMSTAEPGSRCPPRWPWLSWARGTATPWSPLPPASPGRPTSARRTCWRS